MKVKQIMTRLDEKHHEQLKQAADAYGLSISMYVRMILLKYLKAPNLFDHGANGNKP